MNIQVLNKDLVLLSGNYQIFTDQLRGLIKVKAALVDTSEKYKYSEYF